MPDPRTLVLAASLAVLAAGTSAAQTSSPSGAPPPQTVAAQGVGPAVPTRLSFADAVAAALAHNPSVQQAASGIVQAQGLLREARSAVLPGIGAAVTTTTLNEGRTFQGVTTTAQNQVVGTVSVAAPLLAPVLWAQRAQAADAVHVAEISATDVRRQVAVATAQAYLAVIARRRVFEADVRARDTAAAHQTLARQQREAGSGSLLNELRAQQALASDEVLVEQSGLEVYRAQEALGVLVGSDGPVDTSEEPVLAVPPELAAAESRLSDARSDVRLAAAREQAAAHVLRDSWKDWLPSATGLFQPQYQQPATIFQPSGSWRAQVLFTLPVFDAGFRSARRAAREAVHEESRLEEDAVLRQARSEVRTAAESARSAARAVERARAAAEQARRVVEIVNVSFRTGAATNIEVIDAQRASLDAETAAAVAEDALRQARLALLVALGQFPS
jgi:multidrug efflux system outer membrane protein